MRTACTAPMVLLLSVLATAGPSRAINPILTRVVEEAEKFAAEAPSFVTRETLTQRVAVSSRRFRPRIGKSSRQQELQYRTRVLVSDYAFSAPAGNRAGIHEVRSVLTVDGNPVQTPREARTVLMEGLEAPDDRAKQNLLRQFAAHTGGDTAVIDFGQLLLLFREAGLEQFEFTPVEPDAGSPEKVQGIHFRQVEGRAALTVFERKRAVRHPLEGVIWWNPEGDPPLRITLVALREQDGRAIREEASVDYLPSHDGVLMPREVIHRQMNEGRLAAEHRFEYAPFRKFSSETDIYFDLELKKGCGAAPEQIPCPAP